VTRGTTVATGGTGRGFRRIVVLLVCLVVVPTAALLAVGILMLVFWQARLNLVFGILVVSLVACLVTGTVLALVLLRREAKLSKLQLDFVSKVSHELRTPLTSIRMFAEMLKESDARDPQETRTCLKVLERETARLSERIERLLDWGRMEAGRRTFDRQPNEIAALLGEAVQAFETVTVGRRHDVRVEVQQGLPAVLVDRGAMVDALVNLLSNAYKYTPEERVIVIGADADERAARLWVRDSGIGIAAKEHRRIFQKFYRVDERLSRDVEGSGLGLAIVRHVVVGHGGRVEVASEPGRGSTFTIVLPRRQWAAAATTAPAPRETAR
jgi:two-component system, OmpR family, phosphate regulon sensor histidine kinase PhoR